MLAETEYLLALLPAIESVDVAEEAAILGTLMSLPSRDDGSGDGAAALFATDLGSYFPAYGAGAGVVVGGVVGVSGVAIF